MAAVHAQAAAVGREPLDVTDPQPGLGEYPADDGQRKIRKMFVVHGVELVFRHQSQQMREFQSDGATGFERGLQPTGEVVDIGHMGVNIVAGDEVGLPAAGGELLPELFAKKFPQNGDAELFCRRRRAGGGLDTQAGDAGRDEVLEQVAIVGGDFDDEAVGAEREPLAHDFDVTSGMFEPGGGGGGEIGVVGAEQLVGARTVGGLHQPAVLAHKEPERIGDFGRPEIGRAQIGVRRRRVAEVEKDMAQRMAAMPAVHSANPSNCADSKAHFASRSDNSRTGNGQAMAMRGSVGDTPPSDWGAWGAVWKYSSSQSAVSV